MSATADIRSAHVTWVEPADPGTSAIVGYTVRSVPSGGTASVAYGTNAATVTGLQNGGTYTFEVVATSADGDSAPGTSNGVTLPDVPSAPTALAVNASYGIATLAWDAPASDGARSITGYVASASDGTQTLSTSTFTDLGSGSPRYQASFEGLADGATYAVAVHAVNAVGDGVDATAQAALPCVNFGLPGRPEVLKTSGGNGNQQIVALVAGDFDHDGHIDVLAAPRTPAEVNIFHGHGDLTFDRAVRSPLTPTTVDFAVSGDFNGDGWADVFASSGTDPGVYLGEPDGGFAAVATPPGALLGQAHSAAVADLDGDGHPDLVIGSVNDYGTGAIVDYTVLLGAGNGTFPQRMDTPIGDWSGGAVNAVALADVNHDAVPDLFLGGSGGVKVLLGNGDGTFGSTYSYSTSSVQAGAITDLDGDGNPDLVYVGDFSYVATQLGYGDGGFAAPTFKPAGTYNLGLAVADVNHDGHPDVVTGGSNNFNSYTESGAVEEQVQVFLGSASGALADALPVPLHQLRNRNTLALVDLDGDGDLDLVEAEWASYTGFVALRGRGDGTFEGAIERDAPLVAKDMQLVKVDGAAARPSIVVLGGGAANPIQNQILTYKVFDDGGLSTPVTSTLASVSNVYFGSFVAGDLNHDGLPDLAIADTDRASATVALNNGAGGFTPVATLATANAVTSTALCDLDGDGNLDLIALSDVVGGQDVVYAFPGHGDGGFGLAYTVLQNQVTGTVVECADLNEDGRADLVLRDADVKVALGNGDFSFQAPQSRALPGYGGGPFQPSSRSLIVDINGDGHLDLVVIGGHQIDAFLGDGAGEFPTVINSEVGEIVSFDDNQFGGHYLASAADMDGDGNLDLVTAGDSGLHVIFGHGDGSFSGLLLFPTGGRSFNLPAVATGDLNGDGRIDAVTLGGDNGTVTPVSLFLNRELGSACY